MTKKLTSDEAKQRMREYLKEKGVSLTDAEITCSYKRGYLSAGGVVGSDKLAAFVSAYPDCDLYYIITGTHDGDPRLRTAERLISECAEHLSLGQRNLKVLNKMVTNMVTKN